MLIVEQIKKRRMMRIIQIILLFFWLFLALGYVCPKLACLRSFNVYDSSSFTDIQKIGNAMNGYLEKNKRFPDANSWFYELKDNNDLFLSYYDHKKNVMFPKSIYDPETKRYHDVLSTSVIAFNKNLSKSTLDNVTEETVLLFEAEGGLNESSDAELLKIPRRKDRHIMIKSLNYVYICFVDGTIAKYRLKSGKISLYDPENKSFSKYYKKSETKYSPLKWK